MDKDIAQILRLPPDVEKILIGTLYDLSVDDGRNNDIKITDEWTLKMFIEAGIIKYVKGEEPKTIQLPYVFGEHVVDSDEVALNLDNIAASYQETKKRSCVMRINNTLSTIDCLYIKQLDAWYLVEFKNGDWAVRDIVKKVHETLQLLGDLEALNDAVAVTTNRDRQIIEVAKLNLKVKLELELGFDASSRFYKNNMFLYIVYTDNIRKAREFLKFCALKSQYANMDKVFEQYKIFEKSLVTPSIDTGYKFVDILGTYLLKATSNNRYYLVYRNIGIMFQRFKNIDKVSNKKFLALLERIPVFMSEIPALLFDKRSLFSDNMPPDEFMRQLAVYSIRHVKEEEMPECDLDEYDIVKGFLDTIIEGDYLEYIQECDKLVKLFGEFLHGDENNLKSICSNEFVSEMESLIVTDFYEALGRILLIQRVTNKMGCCSLSRLQQRLLVQNILHLNVIETESLLDSVNNDIKLFLKFVALKSYIEKRYSCFWDPEKDVYMHMRRQIHYIQQLYEEKAISGENGKRTRTYGCFGFLLQDLKVEAPTDDFQQKLKEKVNQIEKKILMGNSRMEIHSLVAAVQGLIGSKNIAIQQLKYFFEGSVFKKVEGCKAEDFERNIL